MLTQWPIAQIFSRRLIGRLAGSPANRTPLPPSLSLKMRCTIRSNVAVVQADLRKVLIINKGKLRPTVIMSNCLFGCRYL